MNATDFNRGYHDGCMGLPNKASSVEYENGFRSGELSLKRFGKEAVQKEFIGKEQDVLWMPPLGGDRINATRILAHRREPKRVWTLIIHGETSASEAPKLPIIPQHNVNAFLEDKIHDWNYANGKLRYYSRVVGAQDGVWLLLEY